MLRCDVFEALLRSRRELDLTHRRQPQSQSASGTVLSCGRGLVRDEDRHRLRHPCQRGSAARIPVGLRRTVDPGRSGQIWPGPADAIEFARARASLIVRGNHDHSIGFGEDPRCSARLRAMAEAISLSTGFGSVASRGGRYENRHPSHRPYAPARPKENRGQADRESGQPRTAEARASGSVLCSMGRPYDGPLRRSLCGQRNGPQNLGS